MLYFKERKKIRKGGKEVFLPSQGQKGKRGGQNMGRGKPSYVTHPRDRKGPGSRCWEGYQPCPQAQGVNPHTDT